MDQQDRHAGSLAVSPHSQPLNKPRATVLQTFNVLWLRYGIFVLTILFAIAIFIFLVNKHNAFNTRTYDFARFSQAIWNTLHGRFLFSTIDARSILGNHFSPYMALLSPLFILWPNERMLFLVQAVSVAIAGLLLALILVRQHRSLAPWFLVAIFLNPAVQHMALFEFRRVVLALPFLALALYAMWLKRRWLMLGALLFALLAKEDIGLFVFGAGLFLLVIQRDWRWGLGLMLLGFVWSLVVSLWVIPAFRTPGTEYPQLFYFDYLGSSYAEIGGTIQQDPFVIPRQLFSVDRLAALWRIFLPLGIFLPFLGASWLLIALPPLFMLMISGDAEMYGLLKWYPATILPVFFAAVAVGLGRFQFSKARWLTLWLLLMTAVGYYLYSPLPGGREYDPALYDVTSHDQAGLLMTQEVPASASVATQPHYAPHLSLREHLYHYPWIKIGAENVAYFLFDRQSSPYPFSNEEMEAELNTFLANPLMGLVAETDGIYLFQQDLSNEPSFSSGEIIEGAIQLKGYDVALMDDRGIFRLHDQLPVSPEPGQSLRVDLYWQALAAPEVERTISLRVTGPGGELYAQHDGMPASGSRPTSWWQAEQQVRDVHYLTIPTDMPPGAYGLDLLLYDTYTQEIIPWDEDHQSLRLAVVEVD